MNSYRLTRDSDGAVLTKELRQQYTGRLIKLYNILAEAPAENYNHSVFTQHNGFWRRVRTGCGTAACAIGHAFLHAEEFPGLNVYDLRRDYPQLVRQKYLQPIVPADWSYKTYFGPESYQRIFETGAYNKPASEVTKQDALDRIEDYITNKLGCQLIPA